MSPSSPWCGCMARCFCITKALSYLACVAKLQFWEWAANSLLIDSKWMFLQVTYMALRNGTLSVVLSVNILEEIATSAFRTLILTNHSGLSISSTVFLELYIFNSTLIHTCIKWSITRYLFLTTTWAHELPNAVITKGATFYWASNRVALVYQDTSYYFIWQQPLYFGSNKCFCDG